jgi:hypothetical protein
LRFVLLSIKTFLILLSSWALSIGPSISTARD